MRKNVILYAIKRHAEDITDSIFILILMCFIVPWTIIKAVSDPFIRPFEWGWLSWREGEFIDKLERELEQTNKKGYGRN